MYHTRFQKLASALSAVTLGGLGTMGAYIGVLSEQDHQMHGVEQGPEATQALVMGGLAGFLLGILLGAVVLVMMALARRLLRKKARV